MAYYRDLREHIHALETANKLIRIQREININTELMPLVRWQFRGLSADQRKAFLFENVVDSKGRHYDMPVAVAVHAGSREIYALSMMCEPRQIMEKWAAALIHPIPPVTVNDGPVHEEIHMGGNLLDHGGLGELPVPISTPGFDNAPYLTCANFVSKDPETGGRNVGNYRAMIKSETRTGIYFASGQHFQTHWNKYRKLRQPFQAAIVVGASPIVGLAACMKCPYEADEFAVAGAVAGEPIQLVKCKTIDIEVPATAEIVIEGEFPLDYMERDAPFGEFSGYMGTREINPYFNVT